MNLLFSGLVIKAPLDAEDKREESLTSAFNDFRRAVGSDKPAEVAKKSDRTTQYICFVLGALFVGLGLLATTLSCGTRRL